MEDCLQDLPPKLLPVQDIQVCGALVTEPALFPKSIHWLSPKERKDFIGELKDHLGMVFHLSKVLGMMWGQISKLCCIWILVYLGNKCSGKWRCFFIHKRHAKWLSYSRHKLGYSRCTRKLAHIEDEILYEVVSIKEIQPCVLVCLHMSLIWIE